MLRDPTELERLSPRALATLLDDADRARLLGWFIAEVDRRGLLRDEPTWLRDRFLSARAHARGYEQAVRWEIDRLHRAFWQTGIEWILLKGAAYIASGLPPGRGRRVADVDLMVRRKDLAAAERCLLAHGWSFVPLDDYDTRYYREWMHELPPLVHGDRKSIVDVHHAILPRTSRLQPSSDRLVDRSRRVGEVRVLCPSHMTLHAAAHLFHDGEIAGAIRDLVDIDQLMRAFSSDDAFWADFVDEARELGLTRPAYYAVRYARRWFDTPVPEGVERQMAAWSPPAAVRALMDALVARSIPGGGAIGSSAAVFALYVRSHWLRMPPLQVLRHLARKGLARRG